LRLLDAGHGGDEDVLALHILARLDGEERRPGLDMIAGLRDQAGDAAGIGREDRRRGVFVDADLAVVRALVAEADLSDGGKLQALPLRVGRAEGTVGVARDLVGPRNG